MAPVVWHNPRCSKSRQTVALLTERGIDHELRLYLDAPPSSRELRDVLSRLGLAPRELMRQKEALYKELGLGEVTDDEALIDAMVQHPKLIERPIVIHGDNAKLGRPPEQVLDLF